MTPEFARTIVTVETVHYNAQIPCNKLTESVYAVDNAKTRVSLLNDNGKRGAQRFLNAGDGRTDRCQLIKLPHSTGFQ
jgi:hypothetical protein